jgi:uncharacterized membrane protein YccC
MCCSDIGTARQPAKTPAIVKAILSVLTPISRFFRSDQALFGLRAAAASLAGTIPAFLSSSSAFFQQYRGVWITITVVLGMSPTTGASLNGLLTRCIGTIAGGLIGMAVWYMVDQKVAGVITLSLPVLALHFYFFMQDPRRVWRHSIVLI